MQAWLQRKSDAPPTLASVVSLHDNGYPIKFHLFMTIDGLLERLALIGTSGDNNALLI